MYATHESKSYDVKISYMTSLIRTFERHADVETLVVAAVATGVTCSHVHLTCTACLTRVPSSLAHCTTEEFLHNNISRV